MNGAHVRTSVGNYARVYFTSKKGQSACCVRLYLRLPMYAFSGIIAGGAFFAAKQFFAFFVMLIHFACVFRF